MMTDILALLKKSGSSDVYTSEEQKATSYSGNCNCGVLLVLPKNNLHSNYCYHDQFIIS